MTSLRGEILIDAAPETVWQTIRTADTIDEWYPAVSTCRYTDDDVREVILVDGSKLIEKIITTDDELRRFQYSVIGGDLGFQDHIGTIDVIGVGGQSLVVYSSEVAPEGLVPLVSTAVADCLGSLRDQVEQRHDTARV